MPIVCPHCATSYAIEPEKLGAGRTVRCARCKETWVAKPEQQPAMAADIDWADTGPQDHPPVPIVEEPDSPLIESPPLAAEWPAGDTGTELVPASPQPAAQIIDATPVSPPRDRRATGRRKTKDRRASSLGLPTSIAAMGALIGALLVWRGDVVRLMPQTATFYKTIGLEVNLRGLSFRDVRLGNETVDGKPVLIIEGEIVDDLKKPLEIPRLHFVVRDAKGTAVYAWNTVPEQSVIQPGERVTFRSRLAQPPAEAHSIDVRFFNKRDLAAGAA